MYFNFQNHIGLDMWKNIGKYKQNNKKIIYRNVKIEK